MEDLRNVVRGVLRSSFDDQLPTGQNSSTAFGMLLTWGLKPRSAKNPVLYGKPKAGPKQLVGSFNLAYVSLEMGVDFVVVDQRSIMRNRLLVGCESEMYSSHGTEFTDDPYNSGYTSDFEKLLRFPAPTLLFAARGGYNRRLKRERIDILEERLNLCAKKYLEYWRGRRLYVVLIPSDTRKIQEVRLGIGDEEGRIGFERL